MALTDLSPEAKRGILNECRCARSLVLRDSEAFQEGAVVLEHVGQTISGKIEKGLGHYPGVLWEAVLLTGFKKDDFDRLMKVVVDARNDAVHIGAWARHISSRLVDLLLLLEEGLIVSMVKFEELRVEDLMVREPVIAEGWQLVYHLRKKMLETSFSYLPFTRNSNWYLVSEVNLMLFLRSGPKNLRELTLDKALSETLEVGPLQLIQAPLCGAVDLAHDVMSRTKDGPLLVVDPRERTRLLGILTAFDLL